MGKGTIKQGEIIKNGGKWEKKLLENKPRGKWEKMQARNYTRGNEKRVKLQYQEGENKIGEGMK